MWEWLDGYLTAIRQVASLGGYHKAPDPWAFWTMVGTCVGGIGAAVAAVFSWRTTKHSNEARLETERFDLIREARATHDECQFRMEAIASVWRPLNEVVFPRDVGDERKRISDELTDDW